MSPVTGLTRLAGQILSSVHIRNFSPVTEMKKREMWTVQPKTMGASSASTGHFDFYSSKQLNNWLTISRRETERESQRPRSVTLQSILS